jgi:hypothetical protein
MSGSLNRSAPDKEPTPNFLRPKGTWKNTSVSRKRATERANYMRVKAYVRRDNCKVAKSFREGLVPPSGFSGRKPGKAPYAKSEDLVKDHALRPTIVGKSPSHRTRSERKAAKALRDKHRASCSSWHERIRASGQAMPYDPKHQLWGFASAAKPGPTYDPSAFRYTEPEVDRTTIVSSSQDGLGRRKRAHHKRASTRPRPRITGPSKVALPDPWNEQTGVEPIHMIGGPIALRPAEPLGFRNVPGGITRPQQVVPQGTVVSSSPYKGKEKLPNSGKLLFTKPASNSPSGSARSASALLFARGLAAGKRSEGPS